MTRPDKLSTMSSRAPAWIGRLLASRGAMWPTARAAPLRDLVRKPNPIRERHRSGAVRPQRCLARPARKRFPHGCPMRETYHWPARRALARLRPWHQHKPGTPTRRRHESGTPTRNPDPYRETLQRPERAALPAAEAAQSRWPSVASRPTTPSQWASSSTSPPLLVYWRRAGRAPGARLTTMGHLAVGRSARDGQAIGRPLHARAPLKGGRRGRGGCSAPR